MSLSLFCFLFLKNGSREEEKCKDCLWQLPATSHGGECHYYEPQWGNRNKERAEKKIVETGECAWENVEKEKVRE